MIQDDVIRCDQCHTVLPEDARGVYTFRHRLLCSQACLGAMEVHVTLGGTAGAFDGRVCTDCRGHGTTLVEDAEGVLDRQMCKVCRGRGKVRV